MAVRKIYKIHLIFWNLLSTNGFPVLSTHKNATMISGYNGALLDDIFMLDMYYLCTSRTTLSKVLLHKTYDVLESEFIKCKLKN